MINDWSGLEGKEIFAIPTGNNCRGFKGKYEKFIVVKVKRKYVDMKHIGFSREYTLDKKTGAEQSAAARGFGFSSGYKFFKSEKDISDDIKLNENKDTLSNFFRFSPDVTLEQSEKILEIINK